MKRFVLTIAGVCLTFAASASAEFIGVNAVNKIDSDTTSQCTNADGPFVLGPLTVCNVFAQFDDPTDQVLSWRKGDVAECMTEP